MPTAARTSQRPSATPPRSTPSCKLCLLTGCMQSSRMCLNYLPCAFIMCLPWNSETNSYCTSLQHAPCNRDACTVRFAHAFPCKLQTLCAGECADDVKGYPEKEGRPLALAEPFYVVCPHVHKHSVSIPLFVHCVVHAKLKEMAGPPYT